MTCSPSVFVGCWMYRSLQASPAALLGWAILNTAIAPSTPAAIAPSAQTASTSQSNLVTSEPITEPSAAIAHPPTITTAPQFSQSSTPTVVAQAITPADDGTGTVVTETDNTFDITGGTLSGDNLFHSFEQFGLSADQIANILATPDIENVLGRISGGDPSVINGLLQLTGGDANLFLINPAGIIFGPESQVIVPAAFTATSADAIQFDDEWFQAVGSNDYAALVGDPIGFAFTSTDPGVVMNAGGITSLSGNQVTLLGGTVINTGTIETPSGTVTIAAVPGENLVRISQEGSLLSLELPTQDQTLLNANGTPLTPASLPALLTGGAVPENSGLVLEDGEIKLASTDTPIPTDAGTAIVSGTLNAADATADGVGGAIDVTGDRVGLLNATLDASGTNGGGTVRIGGDYQGQGDIPNAQRTYINAESNLAVDALLDGEGGRVIVWADEATQFFGNITARGGSTSGDGGFVEVSGKDNLTFMGGVDTSAVNGTNGQLLLDPRSVYICEGAAACNTPDGFDVEPADALNDGEIEQTEGAPAANFLISPTQVLAALANGSVTIAAARDIRVNSDVEVTDPEIGGSLSLTAPTIDIAANITLGQGDLILTSEEGTNGVSTFPADSISIDGELVTDGGNVILTGPEINVSADIDSQGGDITFNGPVVLDSQLGALRIDADLLDGSDGNITFNETLDAQADAADSVRLIADEGDVTVTGEIGGNTPINLLEIDADTVNLSDFSGSDLDVLSTNFNLQAQGDLALEAANITGSSSLNISSEGNLTFNASNSTTLRSFSGDITLNSQGNLSLPDSITAQNLTVVSGGNVLVQDFGDFDFDVFQAVVINAQNTLTVSDSQIESGADLTLTGGDIVVTNSTIGAGQSLSLVAQDTIAISDDATESTRFQSEGDMTIRGDTSITINALDQADSVFTSGGNLNLISDGAIAGNGRFLADSDITIATITGDPGTFSYSPVSSPGIVSADGNVSFGDYTGPALKVEATGSISGGDITITEPNTTLTETDPDIPILSTTSALVLRAGVSPFQLVTDQLISLETAQNEPNISSTNTSYALGINSFEFEGTASSPANIEVGNINTSAAEGAVILQAPGDIVTGNINVGEGVSEFLDPGDIDIAAGGSFCPTPACAALPDIRGESVTITAANSINTGDIETVDIAEGDGDPSTSFVQLRAETGDIQVGYILAGAGGIDIDAAGTFRALNSRGSSVNRTAAETIPSTLAQYLNSLGYTEFPDEISFGDFVEGPESETGVRVSLESVDGSIAIRYGESANRQVLVPDENGVLIEGDPSQPFVIGPNYDETAPFLPGEGRNFDPYDSVTNPNGYFPPDEFDSNFEVIENAEPLTFPSDGFPSDAGGVVAGVVASNTDASLSGALQNQLFGTQDPGGGGGGDGGGTGGGGTVGGGTGGDGGTDGGGGIDGGGSDPVAMNADVPTETQNLDDEASDDICEDRPSDIQTADDILTIDEDLIAAGVRSPADRDLTLDPCNNRESAEESEANPELDIETDAAEPETPTP